MQTKLTLLPGQRGTKKLLQEYGDRLLCVRHRYDKERKRKLKTVELIVDEKPWVTEYSNIKTPSHYPYNKKVSLSIGFEEKQLRNVVKQAGGIWAQAKKVWQLPYRKVVELGLEKRIVS